MRGIVSLACLLCLFLMTGCEDPIKDLEKARDSFVAGHYREAIEWCTKIINEGEFDGSRLGMTYALRGSAHGQLDEYERAIEDLDQAIRLNPKDAQAYANRGVIYARLEQQERASEDFDRAIQLNPKDATTYKKRCHTAVQKTPECQKALELNPDYAGAVYDLGKVYEDLGETQSAIKEYRHTLELDPYHQEAKDALERLGAK